jgi:hypothetical protein
VTGSSVTLSITPAVESGDTPTLAYTQPGNGVEDLAGNDLASFSGQAITNNSTVSGAVAFSDDFSGTLANWTQDSGSWSIGSGTLLQGSSDWTNDWIHHNTPCTTINQYVKFKHTDGNGGFTGVRLRAGASGTGGYVVEFRQSWGSFQWEGGDIAMPGGIASGDVFGITITGTGDNTVVRVWKNPTGLPTSAANWNGDSTPDIEFTNNPSSPVDTGLYVGFRGRGLIASGQVIDDFFGGDCP